MVDTTRASAWAVVRRGWSKRCPHCGEGAVFERWAKPNRRCPRCDYLFERDYGETWGVWIVTDRVTLAIGLTAVYFGFRVTNVWIGLAFLAAMAAPLVWSIPRRHGLAIAIVYLGRRTWPNPDDIFPEVRGSEGPKVRRPEDPCTLAPSDSEPHRHPK